MSLVYKANFAGGEPEDVTAEEIAGALQHAGDDMVVGATPDGSGIIFEDSLGQFTKTVPEIMQMHGHAIDSFSPQNANTENVDPSLRFQIATMPDDAQRQMFLQAKVDRAYGREGPQVQGQGTDWFYYDPDSNQYMAMTNAPGLDMSEVGHAGYIAPKVAAETAGFAAAGPGGAAASNMVSNQALRTIAGTKEGNRLEQFLNYLSQGGRGEPLLKEGFTPPAYAEENKADLQARMQELQDPDYMAAFPQRDQARSMAEEGALTLGFSGALSGAGVALPKVAQAVKSGLISRGGKSVSAGAENLGEVVKTGVDVVKDSPLASDMLVKYGFSPLATPTMMASAARLGRGGVTMGAEGVEKLGTSEFAKKYLGERASGKIAGWGKTMTQKPPGAEELTAKHVMGNIGKAWAGRSAAKHSAMPYTARVMRPPSAGSQWVQKNAQRAGESAGNFIHGVGKVGKGVEDILGRASMAGFSAIGKGGQAVQTGGRMGQKAFEAMRPMEAHGLYGGARAGVGQLPYLSEEQMIYDRWRKQRERANMESKLI